MVKGFWDVVKKKDKMRKRNPGKRAGDGKTVSDKWSEEENPGEKGIGGMRSVTCIYVGGIYIYVVCVYGNICARTYEPRIVRGLGLQPHTGALIDVTVLLPSINQTCIAVGFSAA